MTDEDGALLPAPPTPMLDLMREHLREEHGYKVLRLARDLYLGGERKESQHLTWNPLKMTYRCDLCPGHVFSTGAATPERLRKAQLISPAVQARLVGITDPAERDEMTRRQLDGSLNREDLRRMQGADAKRRRAKGKRPGVEERRARLQAWLLEQVRARGGILDRALEEAERLQLRDPDAWARLSGRQLGGGTLRDYWQDIPVAVREGAQTEGRKRAEKSTR
jgi:hypothetical protein